MIKDFLKSANVSEETYSAKTLVVATILLYLFALALRLLVIDSQTWQNYTFDGVPIIITNDGIRWASQIRDFMDGLLVPSDQSPGFRPLVVFSGYLLKVLFFIPAGYFEFFIPAFLSSLIVVPIVLIGKELKMQTVSILAAVLVVGAKGFLSRTVVGFFDDDMLSLVLPSFVLYGIIFGLNRTSFVSLLPLFFAAIFYKWWYPQSFAVMSATVALLFLLTLAKERTNKYYYRIILVFAVAILPIAALYKVVALGLVYAVFRVDNRLVYLGILVGGIALAASSFALGFLDPIIKPWMAYIFKTKSASVGGIYYYTSFKTIGEASNISFEFVIENIINNKILFFVGFAGFAWLVYLNRMFFLMLPLFFMGLLSVDGGARFAPYGSLPFAFGLAFLVVYLVNKFVAQKIKNYSFILVAILFGYFGVVNALQYKPRSIVSSFEATEYAALGKNLPHTAVIYSWWDYGAPVRFFTQRTPNIDSGLNDDRRLFVDSAVLTTSNQLFARNLLLENEHKKNYISYDGAPDKAQSVLEAVMKSRPTPVANPNEMLGLIASSSYQPPKVDKDVVLMLPYRMLSIFGTIKLFSELDLASGKKLQPRFYAFYSTPKDDGRVIKLDASSFIDKQQGLFVKNNSPIQIKSMHKLIRDKNGNFKCESANLYSDGVDVLFLADDNYFVVLDDSLFNSVFIQMYFFDKYDRSLFEKVYGGNFIKVYRVKKYF